MKKTLRLILIIFVLSFLASCASNGVVLPKSKPGAVKTYTVNEEGTVEMLGQDMKTEPKHWLYISCNHWSGCYMRCQGPVKTCKSIAEKSGLKVGLILSNHIK